jgi:hypothetical protein
LEYDLLMVTSRMQRIVWSFTTKVIEIVIQNLILILSCGSWLRGLLFMEGFKP